MSVVNNYAVIPPFEITYDSEVAKQLATIERLHYSLIRRTIEEQLRFEPEVETRNRKPLLRPSTLGTAWELRFGPRNRFRVYYRADTAAQVVPVLAIGYKVGNRLFIGGKEFDL